MSSASANATPLNESCTICHKAPLYKCPRCFARTCSLACSKRHKTLSMCNGVRDPTKYLRMQQLKTPEAFRNDLELISAIERGMEDARQRIEAVETPQHAKEASSVPQAEPRKVEKWHRHQAVGRVQKRRGNSWPKSRGYRGHKPKPG